MQRSVSRFKTRLQVMPQQLLLCVLTIRKGHNHYFIATP